LLKYVVALAESVLIVLVFPVVVLGIGLPIVLLVRLVLAIARAI
jgi:hypothetical protein